MNIDFAARPGFSLYVLLLMVSGLVMLLVGSPVVRRQRPLSRLLNVVFGVGFFGYGFYLAFLFDGGHYVIFFKAFVVPVVLIIRSIAASRARPATAPPWQAPAQQSPTAPMPQVQWAAPPAQPQHWSPPQPPPTQYGQAPQWSAPAQPGPTPWAAPVEPGVDQPRSTPGTGSN